MQSYKMNGVSVVADAKTALLQIESELDDLYQTQYGDLLTSVTRDWQNERERLANLNYHDADFEMEIKNHFGAEKLANYAQQLTTELTQTAALIKINQSLPLDSIVVGAAGSLPGDMQRLWKAKTVNSYNMEYGYSTMGYEVRVLMVPRLRIQIKKFLLLLEMVVFICCIRSYFPVFNMGKKSMSYFLITQAMDVLIIYKWAMGCHLLERN